MQAQSKIDLQMQKKKKKKMLPAHFCLYLALWETVLYNIRLGCILNSSEIVQL